jgi:hypothetical protein
VDKELNVRDVVEEYFNIYDKHYEGGKVYGKSSEDLLDLIAPHVIELNPKSIIDYGCGRSSLINFFWNDGKRKLDRFDPAIREYRNSVDGNKYGLLICTDVLEHIPSRFIPKMLFNLRELSPKAIISISTIPARQKLSDGRNAHLTIWPEKEWMKRLVAAYKVINVIKSTPNGFLFKTW